MSLKEENTKRPPESKFCQQNLPAWQPILTSKAVFPYFLVTGIVLLGLGAGLLVTSNNVKESILNYTNCLDSSLTACSEVIGNRDGTPCKCDVSFVLDVDYEQPVFFYYSLTNFYQNHRFYARSRDNDQLAGKVKTELSSDCNPYRGTTVNGTWVNYEPCGSVANSIFNDTFTLVNDETSTVVAWTSTGIAWKSDIAKKFGIITGCDGTLPPPNWPETACARADEPYSGDEELIVWMRTAALPTFRKFHRRALPEGDFERVIPKGRYTLSVNYNFPVVVFDGTKSFVISTSSWIGGKNPFLGIAFIVVGGIYIVLGIFFLLYHFVYKPSKIS